jgi:hypothetical protein
MGTRLDGFSGAGPVTVAQRLGGAGGSPAAAAAATGAGAAAAAATTAPAPKPARKPQRKQ